MRARLLQRGLPAGVLAACALWACAAPGEGPPPPTLRFAVLPDQSVDRVRAQHQGLIERVCAKAGLSCATVVVPDYRALVDEFGSSNVDVAFFGGVTFVLAAERHGAVPLAARDIDFAFTTVILVRADDPARKLEDLAGQSFSFGPALSTSGHCMPRYFLRQRGLEPERLFSSVGYSASHEATLQLLAAGKVTAGAVNSSIAYRALLPGGWAAGKLRVVWQSPPYADGTWAARSALPAALRQRLIDAFFDLDWSSMEDRAILEQESSRGWMPVFPADFDRLRAIVHAGYTASVIEKHGVLDEGIEFVAKPYTLLVLAQRVRETLDRPARA